MKSRRAAELGWEREVMQMFPSVIRSVNGAEKMETPGCVEDGQTLLQLEGTSKKLCHLILFDIACRDTVYLTDKMSL